MMTIRWQHVLGVMIFLLSAVSVSAQDYPETARLTLDQSLHFLDKEGSDILLPPGTYRLESTESRQLRLSPEAATTPPIIVDAVELSHDKDLATPAAGIMSTDEDSVHVVLFLPGGTALDATGSRSSVRSRAGALTSNQLSQIQVSPTTLKNMAQSVSTPGSPPPPILGVPVDGFSITNPATTFNWRDGDGSPRATSFKLCIAEQGTACGQAGSIMYPHADRPPITGTVIDLSFGPEFYSQAQPLGRFQGKRLVWTVAACAPNQMQPSRPGVISESCTYAPLRTLFWPLPAPILKEPQQGSKLSTLRPTFQWEYTNKDWLGGINIDGVDYWLVCVGKPGIACPIQPVSNTNMLVVQIPSRGSYTAVGPYGVGLPIIVKHQEYSPSTSLALLQQGPVHWTVAACNTTFGCRYQENARQIEFVPTQRR